MSKIFDFLKSLYNKLAAFFKSEKPTEILETIDEAINLIDNLKVWLQNIDLDNLSELTKKIITTPISSIVENNEINPIQLTDLSTNVQKIMSMEIANQKNINIDDIKIIENQLNELSSITNIIKEILTLTNIEITSDYETFLESNSYLVLEKTETLFNLINNSKFKDFFYISLGEILLNFENDFNNLLSSMKDFKPEIDKVINEVNMFSTEIVEFTAALNKAKAKGKIELKQQYDKLIRTQSALTKKKELYDQKEKDINAKVLAMNEKIVETTKNFPDISEYILLYSEEKETELKKNLTTLTKDKNLVDINKSKYSVEVLENLNTILKNK